MARHHHYHRHHHLLLLWLLLPPEAAAFKTAKIGFEVIRNATEGRWLDQCVPSVHSARCCNAWTAKVARHFGQLKSQYDASSLFRYAHLPLNTTQAYDLLNPTYNCELSERVPGAFGDGPKHTCGVDAIKDRPQCLIYSFGSNGITDFETAFKERLPSCDIHTFDPFISLADRAHKLAKVHAAEKSGILKYHNLGLKAADGVVLSFKGEEVAGDTFPNIVQRLHHRSRPAVDILKVDIEGGEFASLAHPDLLGGCIQNGGRPTVLPIRQLQIEVHGQNAVENFRLAELMHSCGMALFSKEPNHWGCFGYKCVELSFVAPEQAWQSYALSHPSCSPPDN